MDTDIPVGCLWCRFGAGAIVAPVLEPPCGGVVGSHPDRLVRPDSRWKSGAGAASIARGWRRPGAKAQWRDTRVWRSCGGRCTRVGTDASCRSIDGRWGRIEPDAPCARSRVAWTSRYGRRRPRETSGMFAGREGTRQMSCIEAETVVAFEAVAGLGRHPRPYTVERHRSRGAIGAEQEAGGPCRVRHAAVAASDGRATASRGFTQQCGSESSSSKDGGSPSKTNLVRRPGPLTRRRAR